MFKNRTHTLISLCKQSEKDVIEAGPSQSTDFLEDMDPDTWLDSDEDPPYLPENYSSSESDEDVPVFKNTRKRKVPTSSKPKNAGDDANGLVVEAEMLQENQVGVDIPFKKRKERVSLKGRCRKLREMRKLSRNSGKEYETESSKNIKGKKWRPLEDCKRKCEQHFVEEDTRKLFHEFWNIGGYSKRTFYIACLITTHEKVRSKQKVVDTQKQKNRSVTHEYHLRISGELCQICKKCFMRVFDLSAKFLEVVCSKSQKSIAGVFANDGRGKNKPTNALADEVIKSARDHILSVPSHESHYSRRHSQKRYLPSHYTLSSLYREYKQKCTSNPPVSRTVYEKLFHQMNLSIKSPKKDTCHTCDKLAMQMQCTEGGEKTLVEDALAKHHELADRAYTSKENDKKKTMNDDKSTTLTFDHQQCLPTPHLQSSVVFYKRQLWTFNLTIHDSKDNQAYCYVWSEVDGGRSSIQIGSCEAKHLNNIPEQLKHVILYSDTCGGQNRNPNMLAMFLSTIIPIWKS